MEKLFNGHVSVRSHIVEECIRKNKHLLILFRNERMLLHPNELKNFKQFNSALFKSKFNGKSYQLYDFAWKPNTQLTF